MKFCYTTYAIGKDLDFEGCVELAKAGGCAGIEFRINDLDSESPGHKHGIQLDLPKAKRKEIRRRMEDEYLETAQICTGFRFEFVDEAARNAQIEGAKKAVELAADLAAPFIRVFGNNIPDGVDGQDCARWVGDSLAQIADFAQDAGVTINLEMHGQFNFWRYALTAVEQAASDNLGLLYNCDPRDVIRGSVLATYERVAHLIRHVHLHDLDSDFPYVELFELLIRDGYEGYASAEIKPSSDPTRVMSLTGELYRTLYRLAELY